MRIMAIADIHGDTEKIKRLSYLIEKNDPEVIVIAGDLTRFGPTSSADKILKELYKTGKPIVAITGNGDTPEIDRLLDQKENQSHQKANENKGRWIRGVRRCTGRYAWHGFFGYKV